MDENECKELQTEELEILKSIYDGDSAFKVISGTQFQYKFGDDGSAKSFILDVSWGPNYPEALPKLSMDTFYNKHVVPEVKTMVLEKVSNEAEQFLGMSMTYSLFESVKENLDAVFAIQPEKDVSSEIPSDDLQALKIRESASPEKASEKAPKKEQLTKSQKKRMWDKGGLESGDRPRGWNWVDVIRHLSQTGYKDDA